WSKSLWPISTRCTQSLALGCRPTTSPIWRTRSGRTVTTCLLPSQSPECPMEGSSNLEATIARLRWDYSERQRFRHEWWTGTPCRQEPRPDGDNAFPTFPGMTSSNEHQDQTLVQPQRRGQYDPALRRMR